MIGPEGRRMAPSPVAVYSHQTERRNLQANKNMKNSLLFSLILTSCVHAFAQDPREAEIRRLEDLERTSVLKSDSAVLYNKIWAATMIVNTPANVVGTVEGTKAHLRSGGLSYLSFERTIEKIAFNDNVAIVMGGEVIKPQKAQPNAGKTVTRRFTHVWLNKNNSWSIIARQATIIQVE
jgi:hypothetical protein